MSSMQDYEVKTGVWGLPSVDETIRIIRHDARHHAGRRLAQQGPAAASVQENMLVIAPGTAQEGFVTRLQDGLLKPDSRAAPAPVSLRKHSGYHEDAWTSTRDHTCQIIKTHLRATLRTSPDTLTGEINALLAKAPILAAINEAASQAATDALGANQRGVRLRMDQAIREFLGESTVRKVLQTFGNNAVLGDVNPALQDNVQKARRICPNAVLLLAKTGWANARMARTRVPEWGNDMKSIQPDNTPRQIIDKAHQLFFQQFGSTTAANTDSQEAAWQMFLRLDPETIRRCPAPWKPVRLIRRAQEAGVEPTRGAAITVLSCLKGNGETAHGPPRRHPSLPQGVRQLHPGGREGHGCPVPEAGGNPLGQREERGGRRAPGPPRERNPGVVQRPQDTPRGSGCWHTSWPRSESP